MKEYFYKFMFFLKYKIYFRLSIFRERKIEYYYIKNK